MKNDSATKWLTGCAVGCAVLLLIVIIVGGGLFFYGRRAVRQMEEISKTESRLEEQLGRVEEFCPDADGRIRPERIRAFLEVRKSTAGARAELGRVISDLEAAGRRDSGSSGFWNGIRAVRSGVGAIPRIVRLRDDRARALLGQEMSPGEYLYIYTVAYYSWLKKDTGEGPEHVRMGGENSVSWNEGHGDSREQRRAVIVGKIRKAFIPILQNAKQQVEKQLAAEKEGWGADVEKELRALESEWGRLPWVEGLPKSIEKSLEPFRDDLKSAYDPATNLIEFVDFGQRHSRR